MAKNPSVEDLQGALEFFDRTPLKLGPCTTIRNEDGVAVLCDSKGAVIMTLPWEDWEEMKKTIHQPASELVEELGEWLVGKRVNTPAMGTYVGGVATVVRLNDDSNTEDIAFIVQLPGGEEMGVFIYEQVALLDYAKERG